MSLVRVVSLLLTVAACLLAWIARSEIMGFRGTLLWDLRYVLLGGVFVGLLSLAEFLAVRIAGFLGRSR